MKKFEQLRGWEDSDFEDYKNSKPIMKINAIRAAVFCVVLVIVVGGIIWRVLN